MPSGVAAFSLELKPACARMFAREGIKNMDTTPQHLMLATFEGHAELAIPALHLAARRVPIRFSPQVLRLEAFLDPSDEVVGVLASERTSIMVTLNNVVLHDATEAVHLKADGLQLYRSNALSEWPEYIGLTLSDSEPEGKGMRRLELSPLDQVLTFNADEVISTEHPYQIYYGNACPGLRAPGPLAHRSFSEKVSFCSNFPQRGLLCAFSAGDFSALEARIHAGWMLIHGRELPSVLQVKGREVCFFGHEIKSKSSYLPLVDDWGAALPDSVMNGFVDMEQDRFDKAYLALKYFLAGKQADVWLEARYMLLMTCVEAMDGEETRQLKEECTAAMLGISSDAALLFNGMRNQLVHGRGSYQQAFAALLQDDMKGRQFRLEPELQPCVVNGVKLDFIQVWLRLCERLDAFWCAYLNVPVELVVQRYARTSLMPAVDLRALDLAIQQLRRVNAKVSDEPQAVLGLRQANQRLKSLIVELKAKLKAQGQAYARLKLECRESEGSATRN